ncbi:hypothetical protein [Persicirhabdus sediminis]|uniref:Uncharacterized protein n=1 Tax=Persicirhabdus sediminis TaxID=454144 RepID=A0A8J7MJF8_9BACT|nr:hypothetical protein [Persicirhabdus sediminis]MBK1792118.1 hypothetical protein [Persicirhabdus sediminis]
MLFNDMRQIIAKLKKDEFFRPSALFVWKKVDIMLLIFFTLGYFVMFEMPNKTGVGALSFCLAQTTTTLLMVYRVVIKQNKKIRELEKLLNKESGDGDKAKLQFY